MTFRGQYVARCPECRLESKRCICADIPTFDLRTRILVLMHFREAPKTTNTGRFLPRMSPSARMMVRGTPFAVPEPIEIAPGVRPLVLHPDAQHELGPEDAEQENLLLVPDATWSQTRRMLRREPVLLEARRVRLPPGPKTRYRLRFDARDGHLATLEAVAHALGILEGAQVRDEILAFLEEFIARTLLTRGRLTEAEIRGHAPTGTADGGPS